MSTRLSVIRGGLGDRLGNEYCRHPVHGSRAVELKAVESVAQVFDGDPHGPRWALTVLALAVDGNPKAIALHGDALEVLAAHLSKPAPTDDAPPHGYPRPGGAA